MNTQKMNELKKELMEEIKTQAIAWLETSDGIDFKNTFNRFCDDPYAKGSDRRFNECGDYVSTMEHESLDIDDDIFDEVRAILTDENCGCIFKNKNDITFEVCLGEPVTINFSDTRRCYAIHSAELGLKTNYSDLVGDDDSMKMNHALYLIESAMRKHGVFPTIVEFDYYGNPIKELGTELGALTDQELEKYGKQVEQVECDQ